MPRRREGVCLPLDIFRGTKEAGKTPAFLFLTLSQAEGIDRLKRGPAHFYHGPNAKYSSLWGTQ